MPYKDPEKRRQCQRESDRRRRATPEGRAAARERGKRWREQNPEKAKAASDRYYSSEKGKKQRAEGNARFAESEKGKARQSDRAAHHRERLAEVKAGGCVDCGSYDRLHLHHVDPSTKLYTVGDMNTKSDELFYAEVAKCVVVCETHHIKRHKEMKAA